MKITLEPDRPGEHLRKPPAIAQPGDPPHEDRIVMHGVVNCAIAGDCLAPGGGPLPPVRFATGDMTSAIAAMRAFSVHLDHAYHRRVTHQIVAELLNPKPDDATDVVADAEAPGNGRPQ